jgi:hypothetical protein
MIVSSALIQISGLVFVVDEIEINILHERSSHKLFHPLTIVGIRKVKRTKTSPHPGHHLTDHMTKQAIQALFARDWFVTRDPPTIAR